MTFEHQFVLAGRGLALLGVLALAVTGEVTAVYVALAAGAVTWTAIRGWQARETGIHPGLANAATVAAMVLIFAPVVLRGATPIQAIAEFLLVLTALRALAARTNRDWIQVYALSFFQLVAASALSVEPSFAALFVAYLLLAPWALVLFHLRREMTDLGQERRLACEPFVDSALFRSVASVTFVLFLCTVFVFVFFPRMGAGFFANPLATGAGLTGFSDEIGLGDVTALKSDDTVALRVTVDQPERIGLRPYWRGAALDEFDGRRWRRGDGEARPTVRTGAGVFLVREGGRPGALLRQEVILEAMENPAIFVLGRPIQVEGRFSRMTIDSLGNLRAPAIAGARIRYLVRSSLTSRVDPPTLRSRKVPPVEASVLEAARAAVAGLTDAGARADALVAYLGRGFGYTTDPGDPGERDPLARFLFETKTGHCEYFASALAVMLRAVGIPSVVVNGYVGGEWNPYGEYFVIRQSDAHSWVEAYIDGAWRTLDPTPAVAAARPRSRLPRFAALLDAYRMRWYRYVVNYNLGDQVDLAFAIRDGSRSLWRGLTRQWWEDAATSLRAVRPGGETEWRGAALALAVVIVAALLWRRLRSRRGSIPSAWATQRYLELLRLLARRGLEKRPADTPDEFYRRIAVELDADREVVARVTALYQQERFSGREHVGDRHEIASLLARLAKEPRR